MPSKPLITHLYTADPSAHVFEGKLYLYPSHDLPVEAEDNDEGDQYQMVDYHVFSQERPDGPVTDHGEALHLRQVPWASRQLWAPDAACRDGRYYLYFPARDREGVFRIGVATAERPEGPFTPEPAPIAGSFSIDPCVFADADGEHYMAFGGVWGGQLQCWTTGRFVAGAVTPADDGPALCPRIARLARDMKSFAEPPRDLVIVDEQGPLRASDRRRRYFEGPWLHRDRGRYYFSWSTGDTHFLAYAVGDSPYGPFTYRGHLLTPPIGWTTHHSIVEFQGRWWLYYHDASLSGGVNHQRCVKVQELRYDAEGDIVPMEP